MKNKRRQPAVKQRVKRRRLTTVNLRKSESVARFVERPHKATPNRFRFFERRFVVEGQVEKRAVAGEN